jgi:hypothetical protein
MIRTISTIAFCLLVSVAALGQSKTVSASDVRDAFFSQKPVKFENVTVSGDLDLSPAKDAVEDAVYQEGSDQVRVFSTRIAPSVEFRNVRFTGKVGFFRTERGDGEKREYRVQFTENVLFENCLFEGAADFELVNFDNAVSFAGTTFRGPTRFVRIGLEKPDEVNLVGTVFSTPAIFQNTQGDKKIELTAPQLAQLVRKLSEQQR